jgi:hypothetical protein
MAEMFWGYAEIRLNGHCLRSVQNRINLTVTLKGIHHIRRLHAAGQRRRVGHIPAPMWDIFARPAAREIGYECDGSVALTTVPWRQALAAEIKKLTFGGRPVQKPRTSYVDPGYRAWRTAGPAKAVE